MILGHGLRFRVKGSLEMCNRDGHYLVTKMHVLLVASERFYVRVCTWTPEECHQVGTCEKSKGL